MHIGSKDKSVNQIVCTLQQNTLSGLVTRQRDTCDLGRQWHKAASSALLLSSGTKAAVLSLAQQTPFPPHSTQGQGRISMWLWRLIPSTMHFNAYNTSHAAAQHACQFVSERTCGIFFASHYLLTDWLWTTVSLHSWNMSRRVPDAIVWPVTPRNTSLQKGQIQGHWSIDEEELGWSVVTNNIITEKATIDLQAQSANTIVVLMNPQSVTWFISSPYRPGGARDHWMQCTVAKP